MAYKEGGSVDPKKNLQLSQIIEQTRRANMPVATLQSILKSCENSKSQDKSYMLEIKSKFSDGGKPEEEILEKATDHAIESGAEDVKVIENNLVQFSCGKSNLNQVVGELEKLGYKITSAEVEYVPFNLQPLQDSELEVCQKLFDKLENVPEVVRIVDNIA
ncbi:unnamed protein product [Diabrotica balteata]|uniref:TACO1/YebC-like second and third domain-containing protein n=1 Tax=Diabrotica balteata TaxID=107213 RepID=A0A9N9SXQ5_DIABA|nr:unnamed protein product [Diabrotica balteata]